MSCGHSKKSKKSKSCRPVCGCRKLCCCERQRSKRHVLRRCPGFKVDVCLQPQPLFGNL